MSKSDTSKNGNINNLDSCHQPASPARENNSAPSADNSRPANLTDEEWQKIIRENPPERVPFVGTFMDENIGEPVPLPDAPYSTGC